MHLSLTSQETKYTKMIDLASSLTHGRFRVNSKLETTTDEDVQASQPICASLHDGRQYGIHLTRRTAFKPRRVLIFQDVDGSRQPLAESDNWRLLPGHCQCDCDVVHWGSLGCIRPDQVSRSCPSGLSSSRAQKHNRSSCAGAPLVRAGNQNNLDS